MATKRPVSPDKPLTLKQRKFVDALPLASSATEAAIKAGYSTTGESPMVEASRTLRIAKVQAAIAEQRDKINAPSIATQIERKELLTASLRGVLPPAERPELTPELRLKASDQLNRMESLYVTKSISVDVNVALQAELTQTFSVDELRALLGKMGA